MGNSLLVKNSRVVESFFEVLTYKVEQLMRICASRLLQGEVKSLELVEA